jgi:hypothetical protein
VRLAALLVLSVSCGGIAVIDPGGGGGAAGAAGAGGAAGGGGSGGSADPICDGGTFVSETMNGSGTCSCIGGAGINVEAPCAAHLPDRYGPPDPMPWCAVSKAHAIWNECKDNLAVFVNGCAGPQTSPCLALELSRTSSNADFTVAGHFVDAAGGVWMLSGETGPEAAQPLSVDGLVHGVATATATKGADSFVLQLSYDVCLASGSVCPI